MVPNDDDSDLAGTRAAMRHERHLAGIALLHVKPEHVNDALDAYAGHVASGNLPPDDVGAHERHAHAFFAAHATARPEHARPAPPKPASAAVKKGGPYKW